MEGFFGRVSDPVLTLAPAGWTVGVVEVVLISVKLSFGGLCERLAMEKMSKGEAEMVVAAEIVHRE